MEDEFDRLRAEKHFSSRTGQKARRAFDLSVKKSQSRSMAMERMIAIAAALTVVASMRPAGAALRGR